MRILVLGGTEEASGVVAGLARMTHHAVTLSLAGRTSAPRAAPVPTRIGGFGGVDGLAAALLEGGFDLLVDAAHPFAARISANAAQAAGIAGVGLLAVRRPAWLRQAGDRWIEVATVVEAGMAVERFGRATRPRGDHRADPSPRGEGRIAPDLIRGDRGGVTPAGDPTGLVLTHESAPRFRGGIDAASAPSPLRILVTIGRQELAAFLAAAPSTHTYLARAIEPIGPLGPPSTDVVEILDRGPFSLASELALMRDEHIDLLVTKNAGGAATAPKIEAARLLGLPVVIVRRPDKPVVAATVATAEEALAWIAAHFASPATERGV